ncbi:nucleotidyltransferase family protein [Thermus thermamylovorans]|uniref:Nucleotidyltransferase domain-containing protein n=1 Tax=Thermus thermamylovorans TaxID=2509362 RepID=A0A4Q9B6B3_9DEIN|nr:nucleotidyltransferase domain-containing protein [Thermus thermamylovorans]TBH21207.1 nucleotidyltransferase domain-containing protein [Thermus thermamylovorans]
MRSLTTQEEVLREVAGRVAHRLRGRHYRLWLFGSRARGEASPRSDYDLALWADPPLDLATLAALREELEALPVLQKVDLVELSWAPSLREVVEREGILLGEGNPA